MNQLLYQKLLIFRNLIGKKCSNAAGRAPYMGFIGLFGYP
jgi:hypothetical protein